MKGVIGKKLGMTQVYGEDGSAVPVTVLDVSPSTVLQVKTTEKDGYEAIQVGFGRKKIHRATKANRIRAEKAGLDSAPVKIQEFHTPDASHFEVGDQIGVDFFRPGDLVRVKGTTKGRGFAGAMKRHGFAGGTRKSHGGGPSHRGVGSVGMSATPSRTMKGRKLPGQYGASERTVRNMMVVEVDIDTHILLLRGGVPGPINGLVTVELMADEPRDYTPAGRGAAADVEADTEVIEAVEEAAEEMEAVETDVETAESAEEAEATEGTEETTVEETAEEPAEEPAAEEAAEEPTEGETQPEAGDEDDTEKSES